MKLKLFTTGTEHGRAASRFESLEAAVNVWLDDHPEIEVRFAHRISQPTFGWGQLAVAVWYSDPR